MCGICGQVTFRDPPVDPDLVRRMTETLTHRGPDEEGFYLRPSVGLGMRRLKVLDLATGQQPMTNEDGSIWVIFNGEIYNYRDLRRDLEAQGHRFTTQSDTEVIVHLYEELGPECVTHLNGMFAFAVWDERKRHLMLARDHLGIKPLYYRVADGRITFASELKALRVDPSASLTVDPASVADYFRWLYIPAPYTVFQDVWKLPPGSRLLMSADGWRVESYWQVTFADPPASRSEDELAEELLGILRDAVRRQLVADVPVGVFLSGGLDSSGIVALARECVSGRLRTFSVSFPGMGLYDEGPAAQRVAERFGCEHHPIAITPSAAEALTTMVRACDEPFGDSSAIPLYYLAREAKRTVTVALSGTGGDDLFAGYRRYQMPAWLSRYQRLPGWAREGLAELTTYLPAHRRSAFGQWGLYARRFCRAAKNGASPLDAYLSTETFCDEPMRRALLHQGADAHELHPWRNNGAPSDVLNACLLADLTTYLPDDLLVKEDRMTMAVGLEARVPLLDLELVRFALKLPTAAKLKGGTTKYLLRRALRPLLPSEVTQRRKHGFAVPVGEWLRGPLAPMFHELVLSPQAASRPWLDPEGVRRLWEDYQRGRDDLSQQVWALLVF